MRLPLRQTATCCFWAHVYIFSVSRIADLPISSACGFLPASKPTAEYKDPGWKRQYKIERINTNRRDSEIDSDYSVSAVTWPQHRFIATKSCRVYGWTAGTSLMTSLMTSDRRSFPRKCSGLRGSRRRGWPTSASDGLCPLFRFRFTIPLRSYTNIVTYVDFGVNKRNSHGRTPPLIVAQLLPFLNTGGRALHNQGANYKKS